MATQNKCQDYVQQLLTGVHNWTAAGHTFKGAIIADADTPAATDDELADWTQVTGTGYTSGGDDIQNDMTETTGTATVTAVDHTWTAGAADWTAGEALGIYNDTSTGDKTVSYTTYGTFTLGNGETFTANYAASLNTVS